MFKKGMMVYRQKNLILSSHFEESVWKWALNEMPATGSSIMIKQLANACLT